MMSKDRYRISYILSVIVIILAAVASAGGLFSGGLYRDNSFITGVWRSNDLITLGLAVPLMAVSLLMTLRGSHRALLVWMGSLWYMVYNYIFYMYAAAFNKLFLSYVALFILSAYGLIFALVNTDVKTLHREFSPRTPRRLVSIILLTISICLGIPWIAMSLSFIVTNQIPQAILQTGHPTGVVFATDLSFIISTMTVIAILVLKRNPWGYVLAAVVLLKGVLYPLVLLVGGINAYQTAGIWDSFIPVYIFLWLICMIAYGALLINLKQSDA